MPKGSRIRPTYQGNKRIYDCSVSHQGLRIEDKARPAEFYDTITQLFGKMYHVYIQTMDGVLHRFRMLQLSA